jgi:hypothetical protein
MRPPRTPAARRRRACGEGLPRPEPCKNLQQSFPTIGGFISGPAPPRRVGPARLLDAALDADGGPE